MIYFSYKVKPWKAALNCPNIVTYTIKIVKFPVRVISEHPLKTISVMSETETVGPSLVQKLKWGARGWGIMGLLDGSLATPLLQYEPENLAVNKVCFAK